MAMHYFIDTGDRGEITHEAAQIRTTDSGASTYAVALCGEVFRPMDSWVAGFGTSPVGRVTCPTCKSIERSTHPLVIEESSLIKY